MITLITKRKTYLSTPVASGSSKSDARTRKLSKKNHDNEKFDWIESIFIAACLIGCVCFSIWAMSGLK